MKGEIKSGNSRKAMKAIVIEGMARDSLLCHS